MSQVAFPQWVHAGGAVTGTTGATIAGSRGFTCVRTGAGLYTITLTEGADTQTPFEVVPWAVLRSAAGMVQVNGSADGVFAVSTFNAAGAAADIDFWFGCFRVNVGNQT